MWMHLPSQLFPSAQELGDWSLDLDSFSQELARSATSRGMFRQPKHWRDVWTMGRLSPLRFGPTLPDSTVSDGLDRWISSWAEFRANRSAWPASARGRQTSDGSGPTSGAGFGTFDRDSSSWRTCRDLFGMDYPLSLETWPKRGSLRNGAVSARRMWERPTVESGYSSWPTATVNGNYNRKGLSPTSGDGLATAVAQWPTPRAEDSESTGAHRDTPDTLTSATRQWQTPRAVYGAGHAGMESETHLTGQAIAWQAPATDSFRSRGGERKDEMGLDQQARTWATPRSSVAENRTTKRTPSQKAGRANGGGHGEYLSVQAAEHSFPPDQQTGRGGPRTPSGVVLNPRFVEALMGLPDGWTDATIDSMRSGMRSFPSWLATHSQRLRVLLDSTSKVRRAA